MAKFPFISRLFGARTDNTSGAQAEGGMAAVTQGDAIASGQDTYTAVNTKATMIDKGMVTLAGGTVKATAAAQSSTGETVFASAETDVALSGADFVVVFNLDRSGSHAGSSYDYSATMVRALDLPFYDGPTKVIDLSVSLGRADMPLRLDGNVARTDFDVEARGDDTFADVDAFALAVEDQLSVSTTVATVAVA